jgi:NTE family protein
MTPLWSSATQLPASAKARPAREVIEHGTGPTAYDGGMTATLLSGTQYAGALSDFRNDITTSLLSRSPPRGDLARGLANQISAGRALLVGALGFFSPRLLTPWLQPAHALEATSYDDNRELKGRLERLVDFDRINAGKPRFSVGAVNVGTGNFVYFDNTTHTIGADHVMASGALPPGFPVIEIEGEHYWDGGPLSNTPLQWVIESEPHQDMLAFQMDLWSARGAFSRNMAEATTRQKEIQYSSRTRQFHRFKYTQKLWNALSSLLDKLPKDRRDSQEVAVLNPVANRKVYNLV